MRPLALAVAAILAAACIPSTGPTMAAGQDCMECHGGGGGGGGGGVAPAATGGDGGGEEDGKTWTIAGTVYPSSGAAADQGIQDARIYVRDATGKSFTLRSNQVGNFYTAESVTFPVQVAVARGLNQPAKAMTRNGSPYPAPNGACNSCHQPGGEARGRIYPP